MWQESEEQSTKEQPQPNRQNYSRMFVELKKARQTSFLVVSKVCSHKLKILLQRESKFQTKQANTTQRSTIMTPSPPASTPKSVMKVSNGMSTTEKKRSSSKTAKTLTFATTAKVLIISNLGKYTEQEIANSWYNPEEYSAMCLDFRRDTNCAKEEVDDVHCTKLGTLTSQEHVERKERIDEARFAVLDEQSLQWEEEVCDDELLADIYFDATRYSQLVAFTSADELARDVLRQSKLDQETTTGFTKTATTPMRRTTTPCVNGSSSSTVFVA